MQWLKAYGAMFMQYQSKVDIAALLIITSYSISLLLSIFSFIYAFPIFIAGFVLHKHKNKADRASSNIDRHSISDTLNMLNSLSISRGNTRSLSVTSAIPPYFAYKKEVNLSLKEFRITGNSHKSFAVLISSPKIQLRKIGILLYSSFNWGYDIKKSAIQILKNDSERLSYASKAIPMLSNAEAMVALGTNFFFPAFAGVIISIIKFSSPKLYISSSMLLASFFMYYIISVNYASSHKYNTPLKARIMQTFGLSSVAAMVMSLTLQLSSMMI